MPVRQNVWALGGAWAEPILWYARGVAALRARPLATRTSWRFYAGIHGFHGGLWQLAGAFAPGETPPSNADRAKYWEQCQHGSWYFLPWHRGYVLAFEKLVRDAIATLPNPPAQWALPYWNYFGTGVANVDQSALPPEFASPDWPDGTGNNPLFAPRRFGPNGDGDVFVPLSMVNLKALDEPDFTGAGGGGSAGFGGVDTGFAHGGQTHGAVETQPHDWVHGLVGGSDANDLPGLMSHPLSAGLDPIFWLHHANIDRLWEVWRNGGRQDPAEPRWLDGPASIGQRAFAMPNPDGTEWSYTPRDMVDVNALGYTYDDVSGALGPTPMMAARIERLRPGSSGGSANVARATKTELVGASPQAIALAGAEASTRVELDGAVRARVAATLAAASTAAPPDRVFLNLENVTGTQDSVAFHVYVGVPAGSEPTPDRQAGSIALFGVSQASDPDGEHGGQGLNFVLEITDIIDGLHLGGGLTADDLEVRLVPLRPVPDAARVRIGRISVVRQAGT
jgi:tyrosinase